MAEEKFELVSNYAPTGDQPQAIAQLVEGVQRGDRCQTLLGVTGSGKTFTMANVIAKLGNKQEARNTMEAAGVPVIPGSKEPVCEVHTGLLLAREIGYPVIIKAALGGGGKGMRVAYSEEEFTQSFQTAQKESQMAFGDDTMYIEHFMEEPRHIEFQILADSYGNVVHLGERDCSIQRNHQKMIEEAPSAALSSKLLTISRRRSPRESRTFLWWGVQPIRLLTSLILIWDMPSCL